MKRYKNLLIFLVAFISIFLVFKAYSSDSKLNNKSQLHINFDLYYLEDSSNSRTFENIKESTFRYSESHKPGFGYTESSYWLKIQLKEKIPELIYIPFANYSNIKVYIPIKTGGYQVFNSGQNLSFFHRPVLHNHYVFPLAENFNLKKKIFIKVKSKYSLKVPIRLLTMKGNSFLVSTMGYCLLWLSTTSLFL